MSIFNKIFKKNVFDNKETLEIVRGVSRGNIYPITNLIEKIKELKISGTLYIGYPILSSVDNNEIIDALLISKNIGLIVFNFPESTQSVDELCDIQDKIVYTFEANLKKHEELRDGRNLIISPQIITYVDNAKNFISQNKLYNFADAENLLNVFQKVKNELNDDYLKRINSAIQKVSSLKPRNKRERKTKRVNTYLVGK